MASYLAELGVSHAYCSPYLQAAPGSLHGYDVVDPRAVNPELGGDQGLNEFRGALAAAGLGEVLDIVPNHMAADPVHNPWWWDVLANGRSSPYASFFDIDWDAPPEWLRGRVLVPILGEPLEFELEQGRLTVERGERGISLRYYEHALPLSGFEEGVSLPELLGRQHYALRHWRDGFRWLNYRRFFEISSLAALRSSEDESVFAAVHERVLGWLRQGELDGVRVDHVDGLREPRAYLERLHAEAPAAWIVVEKILEPEERLPVGWPVAGTTGYDALNRLTQLFIEPASEASLTEFYAAFTGEVRDYASVAGEAKRELLRSTLRPELARLLRCLAAVAGAGDEDGGVDALEAALAEVLACFGVYRTYVEPGRRLDGRDVDQVEAALGRARAANPSLAPAALRLIEDALLGRLDSAAAREFVLRFQQTSGQVMAKGVEDTAFYRYQRFVALNEVGGDPSRFGITPDEFHFRSFEAAATWPASLVATETHDTKRSEDVRARLALLSEMPDDWRRAVCRWSDVNARHRRHGLPDRNAEYLLYQTLVGAHPVSAERAVAFMRKAAREAKRHTSWLDENEDYEQALAHFVEAALADHEFASDLEIFVAALIPPGRVNSLAQKLLALTVPGVADLYQGSELWDLSLVDPDNRRPVDYSLRRRLLEELERMDAAEAWRRQDEGFPKLLVVREALRLRRELRSAFEPGASYRPLTARGAKAEHVVAFARGGACLTVVPRLVVRLHGQWQDTNLVLPPGRWRNRFTGEEHAQGPAALAELLGRFPVALLAAV